MNILIIENTITENTCKTFSEENITEYLLCVMCYVVERKMPCFVFCVCVYGVDFVIPMD